MSTRTEDNILEDNECTLYKTCNFSSGQACQMGLAAMIGRPLSDNAVMFIYGAAS